MKLKSPVAYLFTLFALLLGVLSPSLAAAAIQVAAGGSHVVALKSDGTVWSWGNNTLGQLGDGTTIAKATPVKVGTLTGVVAVAASGDHSLALKSDGTVWSWGSNAYGEVGDNTLTNRSSPVQVTTGVAAIAASPFHSVALKTDGTVWTWGDNTNGQLGVSTVTYPLSKAPIKVVGLPAAPVTVTAVAAGYFHTVAVTSNNQVWTWGDNSFNQLGHATLPTPETPALVAGLTGPFTTIIPAAGSAHTAVIGDGTVWTWGDNSWGQLGASPATVPFTQTPIQVSGITGATSVAAGTTHTAVVTGGSVQCWGANTSGQLGNGTTIDSSLPVAAAGLSAVTQVAATGDFTMAVKSGDGTVWGWGDNRSGQLDNNTTTEFNQALLQVYTLPVVSAVAAGFDHSVAIDRSGLVYSWGDNSFGQLGDGTSVSRATPVKALGGLRGAINIAGGHHHTVAVTNGGKVWGWGDNAAGQLGTDPAVTPFSKLPIQVSGLPEIKAVAAGNSHTLALGSNGTVYAWGSNSWGELGDGTSTNSVTPVPVSGLTNVIAIAASNYRSIALKGDGTVWHWGKRDNSTVIFDPAPVQMTSLVGSYTAIAAGFYHTLALRSDGTVWAWGENYSGELGNTATNAYTPVQVRTVATPVVYLSGVTAIAAGQGHSLALTSAGAVYAWGNNNAGQLGYSTLPGYSNLAMAVVGGTSVSQIAAYDDVSLCLKSGIVSGWGWNVYGHLNGYTTSYPLQTAINLTDLINPAVVLTSPPNGALFTYNYTSAAPTQAYLSLAAAATPATGTGSISKVEFYNGASLLNTDTTFPYSFLTLRGAGTYTLTAKAYDNLNNLTTSSPVTITVQAANTLPTVTLTAPLAGTTYTAPASIPMTATATDSDGISLVEFYDGTTLLGSSATSPYSFTWTGVPAGSYSLRAVAYDTKDAFASSASVPVTVIPAGTTYTVTYVGNGNTGGTAPTDPGAYPYNSLVTVLGPGTLTKTGYTFNGWNTAANGSGTPYAPGATFNITANVTLYAQWTINSYTVTYDGNGNTSGTAPTDLGNPHDYNSTVTVLGPGTLARTGYTFSHWNTAANGSGTSYAPGATFTMGTANVTLYAQWTINTYTVTYDGNGNTSGTAPTDPASPYNYNSSVTVLGQGTLTRTGYTFSGWNTAANGSGISYAPGATFTMGAANVTLYAKWTINTYTVTYNGNGNTGGTAPTDPSSPYNYNSLVTVLDPGTLAKTGYTFNGWNTAANGSGTPYAPGATFTITANVTLYAQWTTTAYSVTYNGNGNTGGSAPVDGATYFYGNTVTVLGQATLTKTGSIFTGWNTLADGTGISYAPGAGFTITGNVTLYAQWAVVTNVALSTAGGVATASSTVSANYAPSTTNNGDLTGKTWGTSTTQGGWADATNATWPDWVMITFSGLKSINEIDVVTLQDSYGLGNVPVKDTTTFNLLGLTSYQVQYCNLPVGQTCSGSVDANWTDAGSITGNNLVWRSFSFPTVTTKAIRVKTNAGKDNGRSRVVEIMAYGVSVGTPTYSVVYDGNGYTGGSVPVDPSSPYTSGTTVTVLGPGTMTRTGYTFSGWNTAADGSGTLYAAGSTFGISGNLVLYAQWTLSGYTVTYDGNGNTGGSAPVDPSSPYAAGSTVTVLDAGTLTRTGYTFNGWNTQIGGGGTGYAAGSTFPINSNVTLYAQWTVNTYTVIYNGNGNDGGAAPTDPSSPYNYNSTVTVLGPGTLTKTGNTFVGWNTMANGSGTSYASGATFTITANFILYAQWSAQPTYTVTYSGNGNTGGTAPVDNNSYLSGSTVTVLGPGTLTNTGLIFSHWNTLANGTGTSYAAGATFTITGNVTLYAQWIVPPTYTVTYNGNGNTGGTAPVDGTSYLSGATVTVLGQGSLTRTGFIFTGWNTLANGSGIIYAPAATFLITGNVTLYAQWTVATNVALSTAGGVATASFTASATLYPASAANNADVTGKTYGSSATQGAWVGNYAAFATEWFMITFSGLKTVNEIDVVTIQDSYGLGNTPVKDVTTFTNSLGLRGYTVQYCNRPVGQTCSGSTAAHWTDAGTITDNRLVWRSFTFPQVATQAIRVRPTASWDNSRSRIVEAMAFGR